MAQPQFYIVYDGRAAVLTTDEACIMETLGVFGDDESAMKEAEKAWGGYDYCLYAYDMCIRGGRQTNQIKNERLVHQSVPSQ